MVATLVFVWMFSTIASAMTGYSGNTQAFIKDKEGNYISFDGFNYTTMVDPNDPSSRISAWEYADKIYSIDYVTAHGTCQAVEVWISIVVSLLKFTPKPDLPMGLLLHTTRYHDHHVYCVDDWNGRYVDAFTSHNEKSRSD